MTSHLESGRLHLVTTKPESGAESEDPRTLAERRILAIKESARTATTEAQLDALYADMLAAVEGFKKTEIVEKEKELQDPEVFFTDLFQKMDNIGMIGYDSHATRWVWGIDKDTRYIDMQFSEPPPEISQPVDESIKFSLRDFGTGKDALLEKIKDKKVKRSIISGGRWYIELE